jgi:hypothetical protein
MVRMDLAYLKSLFIHKGMKRTSRNLSLSRGDGAWFFLAAALLVGEYKEDT